MSGQLYFTIGTFLAFATLLFCIVHARLRRDYDIDGSDALLCVLGSTAAGLTWIVLVPLLLLIGATYFAMTWRRGGRCPFEVKRRSR